MTSASDPPFPRVRLPSIPPTSANRSIASSSSSKCSGLTNPAAPGTSAGMRAACRMTPQSGVPDTTWCPRLSSNAPTRTAASAHSLSTEPKGGEVVTAIRNWPHRATACSKQESVGRGDNAESGTPVPTMTSKSAAASRTELRSPRFARPEVGLPLLRPERHQTSGRLQTDQPADGGGSGLTPLHPCHERSNRGPRQRRAARRWSDPGFVQDPTDCSKCHSSLRMSGYAELRDVRLPMTTVRPDGTVESKGRPPPHVVSKGLREWVVASPRRHNVLDGDGDAVQRADIRGSCAIRISASSAASSAPLASTSRTNATQDRDDRCDRCTPEQDRPTWPPSVEWTAPAR